MSLTSRILIVDDSPEDCVLYRRQLERVEQGEFTCQVAHSAADGLQRCSIENPDCVLLDFNLPDSDGLEFLMNLRQAHGEQGPSVVMLTGQGNETIAVQAMKMGAQDYLVKGLSADGLRHAVRNAIQHMSLRRKIEEKQREVTELSLAQAQLVKELERRAAELSEADDRKNQFLAVLAHELRNPLGPIRNAAQVIRLTGIPLSPEAELAREIIDRQVGHMARLIDDLLDVSRIVRGKILLRKQVVDLGQLVRSTVKDHQAELDNAGLILKLDIRNPPTWVHGDPTRLSQVLGNILDNARKFTPRGGMISVSLIVSETDDTALLKVADSGEGLDQATLERMFEVFSQADRSLDRSRGGLGLGLAIVKGITELHGGNVTATSAGPGCGCEISVVLPLSSRSRPIAGNSNGRSRGDKGDEDPCYRG